MEIVYAATGSLYSSHYNNDLVAPRPCYWGQRFLVGGIIFSHSVHLKLGHRFHTLSEVCSDRDDIVPLIVF